MRSWVGALGALVLLAAVVIALAYLKSETEQPKAEQFIALAQNSHADGHRSAAKVLVDACGAASWRHFVTEQGEDMVEATGALKEGGRPVMVRWRVAIVKNAQSKVSIAEPVFAKIGDAEIKPAKEFPAKLSAAPAK